MNQADILKLADSFIYFYPTTGGRLISNCNRGDDITKELTRFAELVAQHEREQCAKLADKFITGESRDGENFYAIYETGLSEAIRARGTK